MCGVVFRSVCACICVCQCVCPGRGFFLFWGEADGLCVLQSTELFGTSSDIFLHATLTQDHSQYLRK